LPYRESDEKQEVGYLQQQNRALRAGIAAILFAAGHLPATAVTFGALTPLLLFRCFLLNGGFGLVFGWLYRKYGIAYAMMGHALFHVVCKIVLLIFA
jgi:membrane protease YdiL (CAAX protease family)